MGIEARSGRGTYLYRKVREGRRVRSVYVASGPLALAMDALERAERAERIEETSKDIETEGQQAALVAGVKAHFAGVGRIAAAHLEAAGYRRHRRGEWRRRRG